ncbi:hypothetical protein GCWU000341_02086 [Oribacterium sp. oral taxon 078 str. F0262]|nr:hypothetical protein GCWU000341_02086 [Oribacterium sp. oral taxon 078 str. F0262]
MWADIHTYAWRPAVFLSVHRPSAAPAFKDSASPGRHQPTSLREALLFEKWSRTLRVCLMADFCAFASLADIHTYAWRPAVFLSVHRPSAAPAFSDLVL